MTPPGSDLTSGNRETTASAGDADRATAADSREASEGDGATAASDSPPVHNPVTGITVRVPAEYDRAALSGVAADTDDPDAVEIRLAPGASGPPEHVHPAIEERFVVTEGTVAFRVDGRERSLGPGTTVRVSPGTAHGFANPDDAPARMYGRTVPEDRELGAVVATLFGLAAEGRTDDAGRPGPLQGAAIAERDAGTYLAGLPISLQRAYGRLLGPVARRFGYEATYDRYLDEAFWRERSRADERRGVPDAESD